MTSFDHLSFRELCCELKAACDRTQRIIATRHPIVPGDFHEREFVRAMLEDGLLRQAEDELDWEENQVGHA